MNVRLLLKTGIALLPATVWAQVYFTETGGGTDYVGLKAPASVATNLVWTMPNADGGTNQCLATNGSGTLIWRTAGGSGFSLDASDGSPANALFVDAAGNVGIGTTNAASKLDVQGEVKFGNTSSVCNATNEGQQRYNSVLKIMEYCDASAWRSIAPMFTTISASIYSNNAETAWTYSSYTNCPAGYTLQFFGLRGHNAGTSSNYHYCDCSSSGNSIRAGVYGLNNVNYTCTCSGLCAK
jgi:hypothetical protein